MSFYEQLCLLNDEDLPEIKWLETILDEMRPDRDEVCDFILKLESEIEERKQRLTELEFEVRKQNRRLEFAADCKECLSNYASTKLSRPSASSTSSSFKPAVPPRTNSLRKQTDKLSVPSAKPPDDESNYLRLSDCYSSRMEAAKSALLSEVESATPKNESATVRLRRPLKNTTAVQNNTTGRRHTLDEEKIHRKAIERQAVQIQNLRPVASNASPTPTSKPEPGTEGYVNIEHVPVDKSGHFSADERDSCVSPHAELAMIDEQFGFLDNEITSNSDVSQPPAATDSSEHEHVDKMAELRRSLIVGFVTDQKDYVGIMETVMKYSLAIKTTLSSPKPDVISANDFATIFGLIPSICEIEKELVDRLEEKLRTWTPDEPLFAPLVGDKYTERLSLYARYLRDYPIILETATRCLKDSPKFSETCGEIIVQERKQGKMKRRFEDVLILPIVRLQATGLALERIIEVTPPNHPDHVVLIALRQKLRSALDAPNTMPAHDGVSNTEKFGPMVDQKRHVLRPAVPMVEWVTQKTSRMTTLTIESVRKLRYTFLFTDVFVACKRKLVRNRFQFEAVWWFQVSDIKLEDLPPTKVDPAVKSELEELSHKILLIRRNLLAISRGGNSASHVQEQRKKLQQLEEAWLVAAPLVPLRLYNAAEPSKMSQSGTIATSNDSKLLLFLSDFELGDWRRALHACQMRLMTSANAPVHFSKEFLTVLCNEVAEKIGISNPAAHPRMQGTMGGQLATLPLNQPVPQHSLFNHSDAHGVSMTGVVANSRNSGGIEFLSKSQDMGSQQLTGQLLVTVHELAGLATAKACSVVLYVDCFDHFQIQAQTRLSSTDLAPQWNDEFELDLNNSSTMRVVCYSREPDGRDITVGQSALQLTHDWLAKPFVVQPIGLLAASSTDPHLALTLTIRFRPPHLTMRRRHGVGNVKGSVGTIFGMSMGDVVSREGSESLIPRIVTECVRRIEAADGLYQEGLYRISGLVGEVKRVKAAFEKDIASAREQLHMADVNVAAGVLKSFFRELPDPVFTEATSQECLRLLAENRSEGPTEAETQRMAMSIFERLPRPNRKTAFFLLQHLCRVAERSDRNLMTFENLARIWGPTLLPAPAGSGSAVSASTIFLQGQVLLVFLHLVSSGYKPPE